LLSTSSIQKIWTVAVFFPWLAWREVALLRVSIQKRTGRPTGMLRAPYDGNAFSWLTATVHPFGIRRRQLRAWSIR